MAHAPPLPSCVLVRLNVLDRTSPSSLPAPAGLRWDAHLAWSLGQHAQSLRARRMRKPIVVHDEVDLAPDALASARRQVAGRASRSQRPTSVLPSART
jgi:hypothetical protein